MGEFAQIVVNGLIIGLSYVMLSLGITLTFSIRRVINIAHADIYMLGGFMAYFGSRFGINYFLVLTAALIVLGALGAALDTIFFRRVRDKGPAGPMVFSLGLMYLIEGIALLAFGEKVKGVPSVFKGVIHIGSITFGVERLIVMAISLLLITGLFLFLGRVKWGQAMRALAQDSEAAYLQGIDINRMSMLCFALGFALAGAAGVLLTPLFYVGYAVGSSLIFKCFMVLVIGGLGSVLGCLVGGLLLGLIEAFVVAYVPGQLAVLIMFALILVILLVRPQGLMGRGELE
jgi:branched-chain amino acid transport system permease protein